MKQTIASFIPLAVLLDLAACHKDISIAPIQESRRDGVAQLSVDYVYAIVKSDGSIWTWGDNFFGTLGNGTTQSSSIPVRVVGVESAVAFDQFFGVAVASDEDGRIWFWGDYLTYLDASPHDTIPTIISKIEGVRTLSLFDLELYILRNDQTIWYLKLDHSNPTKFEEPVQVNGIGDAIALSGFVVLRSNGTLHSLIPQLFQSTIDSARGVKVFCSVYNRRCLIIRDDSTVWAWGRNDFGQLGNGTLEDSDVPVKVKNLNGVVDVSAHYDYNLALKDDGTVWFWGLEDYSASIPHGRSTPIRIADLEGVTKIYANYNCLFAKKDGSCWIFNVGDKSLVKVNFRQDTIH